MRISNYGAAPAAIELLGAEGDAQRIDTLVTGLTQIGAKSELEAAAEGSGTA